MSYGHWLLPILETALRYKQVLPGRKLSSLEKFIDRFPDVKAVIVDVTQQQV
jgi:hypothetical protein